MNNPTNDSMDSLIVDIVEMVSQKSGRDILELPPIYDYIDPDALNTIFSGDSEITIEFLYAGYTVFVSSNQDGEIIVTEA